jgi:hypothetical protein
MIDRSMMVVEGVRRDADLGTYGEYCNQVVSLEKLVIMIRISLRTHHGQTLINRRQRHGKNNKRWMPSMKFTIALFKFR